MRKLIVLFSLFSYVFANAQFVVDSYVYSTTATTNYYPNSINPNPELITNDAVALFPANNVSSLNLTNQLANGVRTVEATNNGWTTYSRRITATSDGTLKRDRLRLNGILTVGEIYQLDVVHRNSSTTNNARNQVSTGGAGVDNSHAAHTDWVLHSYEFESNNVTFEFNEFVRVTSVTEEWSEYNISLKLKDD